VVRRLIVILALCACTASAVSLRDLVARISAAGVAGWTPGPIGGAVDLDGSTEYLSDTDSVLLTNSPAFTMACWVNIATCTAYGGILYSRATKVVGLALGAANAPEIQFYTYTATENMVVFPGSNSVATGVWTHVVGVCSTGDVLRLYLNNILYTNAAKITKLPAQSDVFRIGFDDFNSARKLRGKIDDVAIWTRALSPGEVTDLYNNGIGKPATAVSTNGLVRYAKLDDGLTDAAATNAYDQSGVYWTGTGIGSGDWTNGIVPIN
jgi:hypothetical protein